jgi:hypothetical protein
MPRYMRCVAWPIGGLIINKGTYGTYSLVVSVDGTAPGREATNVDGWGGLQRVGEHEDGRWRPVAGHAIADAEFVPA